MRAVKLVMHDNHYAADINCLSQAIEVKSALGLPDQTIEDTKKFNQRMLTEEKEGKTVSRLILNEEGELIGITTLMFFDREKNTCHIGSWIGHEYWGLGYNLLSKIEILKIAFEELKLDVVFAGARLVNIRSQKAQEKISFIRLNVENDFPQEHEFLEKKEKQPCVLHAFYKNDFIQYIKN
ncbi:GNAT family N-acetyltransferase [Bacillus albus]|uniref:GNAT family N-acetyltransferase n=1 Tax=Bacillus TaxID=1386 RepID=UPI000BF91E1D|nr:GNAT family N-acetyltransferase [Bacillus albus]MBU5220678.1 GNAT family N-acetyltransferase [Bacillus albus]PFB74585.1 GNAT family N-acetyltransferase [Bacillus anthracis]